jgi:hypothetical protein
MSRQMIVMHNAVNGHADLLRLWSWTKAHLVAGHRMHVEARTDTRSLAQNRMMWACLSDLARQVVWHGQRLTADDWKTMLTAALKKQRVLPGIDGGFVVLGTSTSQMTTAEMTELIEFAHAFGATHDVRWSPTSIAGGNE